MPWLFERKFGIRAFDFWWGYTFCEIDLMTIDQPVIDYSNQKQSGKNSMILSKKEEDEMTSLVAEWNADRKGKSYAGRTFSLDDFMNGKVE